MDALTAVDAASDAAQVARGDVLQTAYFGSPDAHVEKLLSFSALPPGARLLDVGCGVGGVAERFAKERPDLDITLLNFSQKQLDLCPPAFRKVLASAESTGLDEQFDAVLFTSALCQMDAVPALREALRLLAPGGHVIVADMEFETDTPMPGLFAHWRDEQGWVDTFRLGGFAVQESYTEPHDDSHFRAMLPDAGWLDMAKMKFWKLRRRNPIDHHERVAFQFSGGKDSTAALLALRDYWPKMVVYWTDTGDLLPETYEFVAAVASRVPNFVRIQSDSRAVRSEYGDPYDVVLGSSSWVASGLTGAPRSNDQYSCCYLSIMQPMHQRMVADGMTLLVKGQKQADANKGTLPDGAISEDGFELYFPLATWTDDDVLGFLRAIGLELPAYYESMKSAPDCASCTAWWGDGRGEYLARKHPAVYAEVSKKLRAHRDSLLGRIAMLDAELGDF